MLSSRIGGAAGPKGKQLTRLTQKKWLLNRSTNNTTTATAVDADV